MYFLYKPLNYTQSLKQLSEIEASFCVLGLTTTNAPYNLGKNQFITNGAEYSAMKEIDFKLIRWKVNTNYLFCSWLEIKKKKHFLVLGI